jgi:hypothetical protein
MSQKRVHIWDERHPLQHFNFSTGTRWGRGAQTCGGKCPDCAFNRPEDKSALDWDIGIWNWKVEHLAQSARQKELNVSKSYNVQSIGM